MTFILNPVIIEYCRLDRTLGSKFVVASFLLLRVLLLAIGVGYLAVESREIFALRQLTSFTVFVAFFMMANFQMGVSRAMLRTAKRRAGFKAAQVGGIMFIATLFAAVDAALDVFFSQLNLSPNTPAPLVLFVVGWLCNSAAVAYALVSMYRFIPLLSDFITAPVHCLDADADLKG